MWRQNNVEIIKTTIPDAIDIICKVMGCGYDNIIDVEILKKGMTNRSISFCVNSGFNEGKYIMRIPGVGTGRIINRHHEAEVFTAISGYGICDTPVYINPENGYKIRCDSVYEKTTEISSFKDSSWALI